MSTATIESTETKLDKGYRILCDLLRKHGKDAQRAVMAHLRVTTGLSMALPVYHNSGTIGEADKITLYTECINALVKKDFSVLKGQVAGGDKTIAEPETSEPKAMPLRKRGVKPLTAQEEAANASAPAESAPAEDDDEIAAALRIIAERSRKPAIDPAVLHRVSEHDLNIRAINATVSRLDKRLDELNLMEESEVKDIVQECMNNGHFPVARVEDIAKDIAGKLVGDAIRKAAPVFDLDTIVKPKVDEILSRTVKDLVKSGPAALATPRAVAPVAFASSIPDKNSLELKTYKMDEGLRAMLKDLHDRSRKRNGENIMLIGPHGCGKTTLAAAFAAEFGLPMLVMDCANIREPRDWFGYKTAQGGDVRWERSQFDLCLEAGNHVIVLDELPRTTDQVRNTLFPLLDHRRATFLQERGDYIRVGEGTVIFATANLGFQYTGSSELDAALADRFVDRIEVNYLCVDDEADVLIKRTGISKTDAYKLAEIADTVRKKAIGHGATLTRTISTRQLEKAAERYKTLGVAGLTYTLTNHFSAEGGTDSERQQVLLTIQGKFGAV